MSPWRRPGGPTRDALDPPKGDDGSTLLRVLAQTTPALSSVLILRIRDPLSVHTPAESPYIVLFAFSTASSSVRNVRTLNTGSKISSRAMRWLCVTPVNTVGLK